MSANAPPDCCPRVFALLSPAERADYTTRPGVHAEINPEQFQAWLKSTASSRQLPWLADLARLEMAIDQVDHNREKMPETVAGWQVNPTLELLSLPWQGLSKLLGEDQPAEPRAEPEKILVWFSPHDRRPHFRRAEDPDLLALKLVLEEIDPEEVAAQGPLSVGEIDGVLDRAAAQGILLAPPSRLVRDEKTFPRPAGFDTRFYSAEVFTLQWHITQNCDLHCRHCYDRSAGQDISLSRGLDLLDQLRRFCRRQGVRGQVSFSGGNPLLHPHFFEFYQGAVERGLTPAILGNPIGADKLAAICAIRKPVFYQVSLEGLAEHNDYIRGTGHFARIMAFLDLLRDAGVFSMVMLTLTRDNLDQVLPLAELLRNRVDLFTFNRLAMVGEGAALASVRPADYPGFLTAYLAAAAQNPTIRLKDNLLNVIRHQQAKPLFGGCTGFGCGAAFNFCCALPDGAIHACRKFPSPIGHLDHLSLESIYQGEKARRYRAGSSACSACRIRPVCGGCLAVGHGFGLNIFQDRDLYCQEVI
jgi:selenobiotic family peptide radical SAM maturase